MRPAAGVVGAGGAGFPAHVKLNGKAEYVIANGAECEPLLRVDQLLMQREAKRVVRGVALAMEATGAARGVIATKAHYHDAVHALEQALGGRNDITLHLMDSYYPSGDEKSIIFEVSGRVVPSGKLPLDVGCVVSNVATLVNISAAVEGTPVIRKDVTVGGDVPHPITVTVPIGSPIREVIALSGFSGSRENFALIVGGPCMGRLEEDWDAPITKTTGGLLLLRRMHPLIVRRTQSPERMLKVARAVCCQCSQCTQMCPRNALGLNVQPHKAMRALITGNGALLGDPKTILACSSCGVCTNYACHMGLVPSEVMALYKSAGVNPMGGCIPMLIQFPILIAMFRFFPASIELRGKSFLWADDLSSYDSILHLPFNIPFYGDHVSLFALLMAVSVFISSKINYAQTAGAGPQMAGMKFMMLYLMPLMLLFWFNNYSSGLSYYYLVSNIITIGQTYAFRYIVNEDKLHHRMKENAKKDRQTTCFVLTKCAIIYEKKQWSIVICGSN